MNQFKTISGNRRRPHDRERSTESSNRIAPREAHTIGEEGVAAILEKDQERQIQGVDIGAALKVSLDSAAKEEEADELTESAAVEAEARANER